MQETADLIFHVEPPLAPGLLPTGPLVLQGWVYGKPGRHIVDLRARYLGRLYPAVFGIPRADLAVHFKHHRPQLMAGFDLGLSLTAGNNLVELEALDLGGDWLPLGSHAVNFPSNQSQPAAPAGAVHPYDFSHALRLLLRRASTGDDLTGLAQSLADELPVPHSTRFPNLPFRGHLHHPALVTFNYFGRLMVEGWLFHETQPIRRVLASYDLLAWQTMDYGGEMPYVAAQFPQFANARACAIHGQVDVPAQLPSPLSLRIYAELGDGTWELCQLQRSHFYDAEQVKLPFAPCSNLTFWRAWRALQSACRQRGFRVDPDRLFRSELLNSWREYRARAPHRLQLPVSVPTAPAPAAALSPPPPRRVTLITHNLNHEGAPLFLLEYARHLAAAGTQLAVISAAEGPLRADYERLSATVQLVDVQPLLLATDARGLRRAIAALARQVDLHAADLVVANTVSAFWGVHLAAHAGRRSLLYIHESTTPDSFYYGHLAPKALRIVEETFALASHVSFLTDATRHYYRPLLTRPNHSINPGWIDLAGIDRFRSAHPRAELRAALGLSPTTQLVVNVGTVCERKGQHIFIRAIEQLWREQPALAAQGRFLMIGGNRTGFDEAMDDLIRNIARPNLQVMPSSPTPYDYYGAADLFVCSSYEESFPRVVLEAMAFSLPILATQVHGIPEMARAGQEAELVAPGDTCALARSLTRLLQNPPDGRRFAQQARRRVAEHYDSAALLPRHAALASAVAAENLSRT
jgi:glycosyltransferase involved in cell wall biosynthesis